MLDLVGISAADGGGGCEQRRADMSVCGGRECVRGRCPLFFLLKELVCSTGPPDGATSECLRRDDMLC